MGLFFLIVEERCTRGVVVDFRFSLEGDSERVGDERDGDGPALDEEEEKEEEEEEEEEEEAAADEHEKADGADRRSGCCHGGRCRRQ